MSVERIVKMKLKIIQNALSVISFEWTPTPVGSDDDLGNGVRSAFHTVAGRRGEGGRCTLIVSKRKAALKLNQIFRGERRV